jgi:hypothetical protein
LTEFAQKTIISLAAIHEIPSSRRQNGSLRTLKRKQEPAG